MAENDYSQLEGNESVCKNRKTTFTASTTTLVQPNDPIDTQHKDKSFVIEKSIYKETFILFKLSLQIAAAFFIDGCLAFVPKAFIGHLPNASLLSASTIAGCFTYMIAIFPAWGFSSGLWTLLPQFVGGNQTHLIALSVQRAIVICFIVQIPLCILLLYSKPILYFIGINKDNDIDWDLIENCCYAFIPYPFVYCMQSILQRVAQCLNLSFEITIIAVLNLVASIALNYAVIHVLKFGCIGAILCNSMNFSIGIVLMASLLMYKGYSLIFKPLPYKKIFDTSGIIEYLRLAIPGCIQLNLQLLPTIFIVLLGGFLHNAKFAVSVISITNGLNRSMLVHQGIGNASGIRIGNYIGANSIFYAKRCIKIQIFYELFLIMLIYVIYTTFNNEMPKLFTNDSEICSFISNQLMYLLLFNQINKGIYASVVPIYRALGYNKTNVYVSFVTQYVIAYPLCFYLLFSNTYHYYDSVEMGIYVILICDSLGILLSHICLIFLLIYYIDWNKALEDSNFRIKVNNANSSDFVEVEVSNINTNNNNEKISRSL